MSLAKQVLCVAHKEDLVANKALEVLRRVDVEGHCYEPVLRLTDGSLRFQRPCIVFRSISKENVRRNRPQTEGEVRFRSKFLRIIRDDMHKHAPTWAPGARLVIYLLRDENLIRENFESFECAVKQVLLTRRAMKRFD